MPRTHHSNGFGGVTGDRLATAKPMITSGQVWYVLSSTGSDAGATAGRDRSLPYATLSKALNAAGDGDVIILLDGHTEEYDDGGTNVTQSLTIVGEGTVNGQPSATLIHRPGANQMFQVVASTVALTLRNIKFQSGSKAATPGANTVAAVYTVGSLDIDGCRFEADEQSDEAMLWSSSMSMCVRNTTFISTAASASAKPKPVVRLGELTHTWAKFRDCVFDGGTYGFNDGAGNPYAMTFKTGGFTEVVMVEGCTLKNGADVFIDPAVVGNVNFSTVSGSGRVVW